MNKLKFIIFSILGFAFFLLPLDIMGTKKIAISHIVGWITSHYMGAFMTTTLVMSLANILLTLVFVFYTSKKPFLNELFKVSWPNRLVRVGGSFLYMMVIFSWFDHTRVGSLLTDPNTGGVMAGQGGLLTTLYITFFFGLLVLPLLTQFGAVEFVGILLGKMTYKVFKVPGYAAVDALASFVGDGTIGIVVTDQQYQRGYYNRREAYIIATSFSIVGVAFASAVAEELGFASIFPLFYGTIALVTCILAFITARLPLKKFKASYYQEQEGKSVHRPDQIKLLTYALDQAALQAQGVKLGDLAKDFLKAILNIYVGFLPLIMVVGTLALVMAEHTSLFTHLSLPLEGLYQVLGYSSSVARDMAPATIVGLADMYLPALFIGETSSESARFMIGVLAFTQLVFMSETGMILIKSKIKLSLIDILKVFLFRTLVSIPLVYGLIRVYVYMGIISF